MRRITLSRFENYAPPVVIGFVCLALLAGCGGSATPTPPAPAAEISATPTQAGIMGGTPAMGTTGGMQAVEQEANTTSYKLQMHLGEPEKMMTAQEAKGATSGEVMVSGEMASGMGTMAPNYHLEVAVSDIKSGAVITDKSVSIELTNDATKEKTPLQVATMYGVDKGPIEMHFGNNVALTPGAYTVKISVAGETAEFKLNIPNAGSMTKIRTGRQSAGV